MKTIELWLTAYAASHRHPRNIAIHKIAVPTIFFSILAVLSTVPLGFVPGNLALLVSAVVLCYYATLSWRLAAGILVETLVMLALITALGVLYGDVVVRWLASALFAGAWVLQFWGHHIEGQRPSFLQDLRFLLIGPLWTLACLYRRLGISY